MKNIENNSFCIECRKETSYHLETRKIYRTIRDKEYEFYITVPVCDECGNEINIPGILDKNVEEIDYQYREKEGIVKKEDIIKLMRLYNIGKAPLSLALGFGEKTITRYLEGQVPSKEYSDIINKALASSGYMKDLLKANKSKLTERAYNKTKKAIESVEEITNLSDKMISVVAIIFEKLREVTPLMLQKLLYYSQALNYCINGKEIFDEDCEAWVHGPVYSEVYEIFKDFKYNVIEDERFAVFAGAKENLKEEELKTINLVVNTFGMYSGKTLEKITHKEKPWKIARKGYGDSMSSNVIINKNDMYTYFTELNGKYDICSETGLNKYIQDILYSETSEIQL